MIDKKFSDVLRHIPPYSRFLTVREIDMLTKELINHPNVKYHIIGKTIDEEPLIMLDIGTGDRTALIIGAPHSDEPLGSLVITYFARWLANHPEAKTFGWRWLLVPALERRGMRLNEGWFGLPESLSLFAKSTFREPTDDQYEWTFPISYDDYKWTHSRPETIAIKNILEQEKPSLLCGLHHTGFGDAYYYFSEDFPEVYEPLRKFVASLRVPLSENAPDVPFGTQLSPGFYQMYGLRDYLDYYYKKDPSFLSTVRRGACSDEWYQNEIGGFSFNCEVPMYLTIGLRNPKHSGIKFKIMMQNRYNRKRTRVEYSERLFENLKDHKNQADPILYYSAEKHVANARLSLEHEERVITAAEDKIVTEAEIFENDVLTDLFDLFFLGQVWRVAESICIRGSSQKICRLMDSINLEIQTLAKSIHQRGHFFQLPIRTSVKMQLGSILLIADSLAKR